ncbi:MAG: class I SAM-dependent methyltransferase [Pseudomonadota bacterium]
MSWDAFFTLHRDLPREGPGDRDSLDWSLSQFDLRHDARILDAACGPGADVADLLAHAPKGHVTALDKQAHFVAAARARFDADTRVTVQQGDMAEPGGPYDLIWCAGALYFLGVETGLRGWRRCLTPGGHVVFSEPVLFSATPSRAAIDFWESYPAMQPAGIQAAVHAAGYDVLATAPLSDAAWEAYFGPVDTRIAALRASGADEDLAAVLDQAEAEAAFWRAHRSEVGYMMVVARPR